MTRETTERCLGKRTAHAMRAAAIRLALQRVGEDADPALAYGCVDWFRYDVKAPPPEVDTMPSPAAGRRGVGPGGTSPAH